MSYHYFAAIKCGELGWFKGFNALGSPEYTFEFQDALKYFDSALYAVDVIRRVAMLVDGELAYFSYDVMSVSGHSSVTLGIQKIPDLTIKAAPEHNAFSTWHHSTFEQYDPSYAVCYKCGQKIYQSTRPNVCPKCGALLIYAD